VQLGFGVFYITDESPRYTTKTKDQVTKAYTHTRKTMFRGVYKRPRHSGHAPFTRVTRTKHNKIDRRLHGITPHHATTPCGTPAVVETNEIQNGAMDLMKIFPIVVPFLEDRLNQGPWKGDTLDATMNANENVLVKHIASYLPTSNAVDEYIMDYDLCHVISFMFRDPDARLVHHAVLSERSGFTDEDFFAHNVINTAGHLRLGFFVTIPTSSLMDPYSACENPHERSHQICGRTDLWSRLSRFYWCIGLKVDIKFSSGSIFQHYLDYQAANIDLQTQSHLVPTLIRFHFVNTEYGSISSAAAKAYKAGKTTESPPAYRFIESILALLSSRLPKMSYSDDIIESFRDQERTRRVPPVHAQEVVDHGYSKAPWPLRDVRPYTDIVYNGKGYSMHVNDREYNKKTTGKLYVKPRPEHDCGPAGLPLPDERIESSVTWNRAREQRETDTPETTQRKPRSVAQEDIIHGINRIACTRSLVLQSYVDNTLFKQPYMQDWDFILFMMFDANFVAHMHLVCAHPKYNHNFCENVSVWQHRFAMYTERYFTNQENESRQHFYAGTNSMDHDVSCLQLYIPPDVGASLMLCELIGKPHWGHMYDTQHQWIAPIQLKYNMSYESYEGDCEDAPDTCSFGYEHRWEWIELRSPSRIVQGNVSVQLPSRINRVQYNHQLIGLMLRKLTYAWKTFLVTPVHPVATRSFASVCQRLTPYICYDDAYCFYSFLCGNDVSTRYPVTCASIEPTSHLNTFRVKHRYCVADIGQRPVIRTCTSLLSSQLSSEGTQNPLTLVILNKTSEDHGIPRDQVTKPFESVIEHIQPGHRWVYTTYAYCPPYPTSTGFTFPHAYVGSGRQLVIQTTLQTAELGIVSTLRNPIPLDYDADFDSEN